jgi:protein-arginine kinase activator protein McsA
MAEKSCENCGNPFNQYMDRQRFCCRVCSDAWFQNERRQAVEWFRQRDRDAEEAKA